jgi:CRISPR-associated protein Csm1
LHDIVKNLTIAGLLHDVGKILHRGTNIDGRAHSISGWEWISKYTDNPAILDSIRYHHHRELEDAKINPDSIAYIIYIADNIAAGVDRRDIEGEATKGFARSRLQESIYNLLHNSNGNAVHKVAPIEDKINFPHEIVKYDPAPDYNNIIAGISEGLHGIEFRKEYVNSLLELTEAYLSYIPSSTYLGEVADISLFDHSKITAALAVCIYHYLSKRTDYRLELFTNRHSFYQEKAFCLLSCDISGVQSFIYTISSKGALKGLRSRSFYLELLLENLADEILSVCSLYRTNLLYTGGGHAHILLPNTSAARDNTIETINNINQKLRETFSTGLFIAYGMQECSASELMNKTDDPEAYSNIYRSMSAQISEHKLRRYTASEIRQLNKADTDKEGRECRVCGISGNLVERTDGILCSTCAAFADISTMLIKKDTVFVVTREKINPVHLPLFANQGEPLYFQALREDEVKELLIKSPEKVERVYSKNTYRTGLSLATKLWLGDFSATNSAGDLKTFTELADASNGISRIGILRADVDDMGAAFVSGFIRENETENKYRYMTLSRTSTLSRSLSLFFKYYLNNLLANGEYSLLSAKGKRNIVVVYSGGDDLFLVGAWNEVLCAAIDIRRAFARYTGNTLTISAGFAVFEPNYPIARMAAETEQLEASAKHYQHATGMKNAISLLGMEIAEGQLKASHTYDWDTFENQVLGEKYLIIDSIFSDSGELGNSFLYKMLELLRQAEKDSINIARLAYLLARREPSRDNGDGQKQNYRNAVNCIYNWALNTEDRRQLITAIIIYTYYNREKKEGNGNE